MYYMALLMEDHIVFGFSHHPTRVLTRDSGVPVRCLHSAMRLGKEQRHQKVSGRNLRLGQGIHRSRKKIIS